MIQFAADADVGPVAVTIENSAYKLTFDNGTGLLNGILNKRSGVEENGTSDLKGNADPVQVSQDFTQYLPASSGSASGAYIFRPVSDDGIGDAGSCGNSAKTHDTCCISSDRKKHQCKNMKTAHLSFIQPLVVPSNTSKLPAPEPVFFAMPVGNKCIGKCPTPW
jgi:hypothetical protein